MKMAALLAALLASTVPLPALGPPPGAAPHQAPSFKVPYSPGPGNRDVPYQPKNGPYSKPTPVPIERKVSVLADLALSIEPGEKDYTLHVLSSLPVRNLVATNKSTGAELARVKLDDAVDFFLKVDGLPNSATALTLDLNMGVFKGKARIRQAVFDLMEAAPAPGALSGSAQATAPAVPGAAQDGDEAKPSDPAEPAPE